MNIKCRNCSKSVMTLFEYLFKMPAKGINCRHCESSYTLNVFVFIAPLLVGTSVHGFFLLKHSVYISIPIQLLISSFVLFSLILIKPLVLLKKKPSNEFNELKWYASPLLYIGLFFLALVTFFFTR